MLDKIKLNLGIKKLIRLYIAPGFIFLIEIFDNYIIAQISGALNKYLSHRIISHYGADYNGSDPKSHNLDYKTGNLGYGLIHYSLIRNIKPKRVLCIGSMYGFIPFICTIACTQNKKGSVDFVDASYDVNSSEDEGRHNFGQGFWKRINPKSHFSYLTDSSRINTHIMTTNKFSKIHLDRKYQYIYVDGDHTYEGVKNDFNLFWKSLDRGGFMVFHDTDNFGKYGDMNYNVTKFITELKKNNKNMLHFPNIASGLVILQKK